MIFCIHMTLDFTPSPYFCQGNRFHAEVKFHELQNAAVQFTHFEMTKTVLLDDTKSPSSLTAPLSPQAEPEELRRESSLLGALCI